MRSTMLLRLDAWNGYLGDSRYYPMDELDEFCVGMTPTEILQRAFFGYDEDTWTGEGDRRDHGCFNPNREWFWFNGYANLISTDYKDYSAFLNDWFIGEIDANRRHVGLPEEVEEWLDAIEEE